MRAEEDCGKYSVEWTDRFGNEVCWKPFMFLKDAKAYVRKHHGDLDKYDIHIKKWKIHICGTAQFPYKEWECVDTIELFEILR